MKNERGGINLITLIWIVMCLVLTLFLAIIVIKFTSNEEGNTLANNTETNNTRTNNTQTNNVVPESPVVDSQTKLKEEQFNLAFLKKENEQKNKIYSPLSIKYALKMLQEGAKGNTYTQIENVIGNINLPKYNNIKDTLSLANGIFIRDTYYPNVRQSYQDILANKYNAEIVQDKFESANNVNSWIKNKTLGIIKSMLSDKLVTNPDLAMLLINALAIDMEWEDKFEDKDTSGKTFYKSDGTEIQATTMSKETSSKDTLFYLGEDVTALSMNLKQYDETQMEFLAIMPKNNLQKYVENLSIEEINNITSKLKPASDTGVGIDINIPKFSFEYDLKLKKDLIDLGITDAFDNNKADFSNMADIEKTGKNLYVSDALHKANIDFTEKGVKAAAVTVFAVMEATALRDPVQPIEVNIDKPFVFLIRDKNTKEIWFVGTVYEPNLWENDKELYKMRF